jgi:hypothetical protein
MATVAKTAKREERLVSVHRSFGTAYGYNEILKKLERFLNYQFHRFLIQNGIQGRWYLSIHVSQDGAPLGPEHLEVKRKA